MKHTRILACLPVVCAALFALPHTSRAMQESEQAAHTETPAPFTVEPRWPERKAVVVRDVEVGPWALSRVGFFGLGDSEWDKDAAKEMAGILGVDPERIRFEQAGAIVVRMPAGELLPTAGLAGKPVAACEVLSVAPAEENEFDLERTIFALYTPKDWKDDESRGLVVLLPGMFGTPEPVIDSVVGQLREGGWHVLRMLTHSSRFTQQASYTLVPTGDIEGVAGQVADVLSDRAGECALAVEAACAFFADLHPTLPIDRRIALGMSGGGMILPTVVAREHDAYKAAVLIGAGCDYAAIAMDSNYTDWIDAVRVSWSGEPTVADRERFTEAYRTASTLDSYNTAPMMTDLPILMLHGMADRAVPAAMGDLLWQRLGEPERWTVPAGHEVLFLAYVPSRAEDMLDWMARAVSPAPNPTGDMPEP